MPGSPRSAGRLLEGGTGLASLSRWLSEATRTSAETEFPESALSLLRRGGWLEVALPTEFGGLGLGIEAGRTTVLLRLLAAVGRGDLSVGRVFEGHVNALQLVSRFGSREQIAGAAKDARDGHLFGVWNTDVPDRPLSLAGGHGRLAGAKSFASGVDVVTRALVTVQDEGGRRLLLLPLDPRLERIDRSWWQPIGMAASGSHVIDLDGRAYGDDAIVGAAGDYVRQPWLSAGAIRFAAVQVGGMHAVFDAAREHLVRIRRHEAPMQQQRLARMGMAVEGGYAWLDRAAAFWEGGCLGDGTGAPAERAVAHANLTRTAIEEQCMEVLSLAQRGVGCAGLMAPHPLERRLRDLMVYLRQPDPRRCAGAGRRRHRQRHSRARDVIALETLPITVERMDVPARSRNRAAPRRRDDWLRRPARVARALRRCRHGRRRDLMVVPRIRTAQAGLGRVLVAERRKELLNAIGCLGLPEAAAVFLDIPDERLSGA